MNVSRILSSKPLSGVVAAALALAIAPAAFAPVKAQGTQRPTNQVTLSIGRGQMVTLPTPAADVFVSNETVADVNVRSARQVYIFGKAAGESTVFITAAGGKVVYSANIRVGANVSTLDEMLQLAMPEAHITSTSLNGMVLLTGTIRSPDDAAEAERLVQAYVGDAIKVVSRLRTATPLQVNLQVKIAEVNRSFIKEIGVNHTSADQDPCGGTVLFGISQGRQGSITYGTPQTNPCGPANVINTFAPGVSNGTTVGVAQHLLGIDLISQLDFGERYGLVSTLAQPNLTALSGETASFLAGGEYPIPVAQQQGSLSIEYRPYGVSLAFTPTVLDNGRISMRVRPEVSELTAQGTIRINGFDIPGVSTRRTETTVELGSGQAFMIAGLLSNSSNSAIDRAPGVGNIPVLGALFRSTRFRKNETELVIVVTPYLVEPVSANQIALPTDGFRDANDIQRVFMGQSDASRSGEARPVPTMAPPAQSVRPVVGNGIPGSDMAIRQPGNSTLPTRRRKPTSGSAAPGFSGN